MENSSETSRVITELKAGNGFKMSTPVIYPPEEYTLSEKDKILEFRKTCASLDLTPEQKTDHQLIRWLRARDMDIPKALKMLEEHLQWRKENRIDGFLEREKFPEELIKAQLIGYLGVDKQGYPILLAPFGIQDTRGLIEKYGEEMITKITFRNMEQIADLCKRVGKEQGREVNQIVEICDFEGYSFRQFASKQCRDLMGRIQKQFDNNYPEVLHLVVAINAPKVFHMAFKFFKPFMSKRTLEKIEIHGPDRETWIKRLQEKFPMELVPKHWGGTREGSDEYCSKDEIWLNGPLSPESFSGLASIHMDEGTTAVTINARDSLKIPVDIKVPGSSIVCGVRVESHDIGFKVLDPAENVVKPYKRISSSKVPHPASIPALLPGTYTLHFDNTYSVARSKTIHYSISLIDPEIIEENGKEEEEKSEKS